MVLLSLLSLIAVLPATMSANVSGIPGALNDAAMVRFYNDSTTRATKAHISTCTAYPAGRFVPWDVVARDWVTGGGRKEDCAAALIVASGETACTPAGCESVQSGIWQVTSPDLPPPSGCTDGDTNPCCTVDYVRNHFTTYKSRSSGTTSWQVACMGEFNKGNGWAGDPTNPERNLPPSSSMPIASIVPEIVPKDHSGGGLGGMQSNWIGPFCHQGGFTCQDNDPYCTSHPQTGISGDNWGGGSEWKGTGLGQQIFPFPFYYYAKFVESQGTGGMTQTMHCNTLATCGGIPSSNLPDCKQPVTGQAITDLDCFNRITDFAVRLAQGICSKALWNV